MRKDRLWTEKESAVVLANVGKMTARQISGMLPGRTAEAVRNYCYARGIAGFPKGGMNKWTAKDVAYLRENVGRISAVNIAKALGCSHSRVDEKIRALGLKGFQKHRPFDWTPELLDALSAELATLTFKQFGEKHGISVHNVSVQARKMGIKSRRFGISDAELERLRGLQATHTRPEAARALGISHSGLKGYCEKFGLRFKAANVGRMLGTKNSALSPRSAGAETKRRAVREVKAKLRTYKSVSRITYCPDCGAPVSNWSQHYARLGHLAPWLRLATGRAA